VHTGLAAGDAHAVNPVALRALQNPVQFIPCDIFPRLTDEFGIVTIAAAEVAALRKEYQGQMSLEVYGGFAPLVPEQGRS
jgi:hypothetical protein